MPRDFEKPLSDSHAGLCYEAAAPVSPEDGKVEDGIKGEWLDAVAAIRIPEGYASWFKHRWRKALEQECFVLECVTTSRLLVGSGNASGSEVGLQLHHTWGVPMVPGTAVKGELSHYLHAVYGPDPEYDGISPMAAEHPDPERARFRRPGKKPATPPGDWQRIIFGSADYEESRAAAGHVIFHDMLLVPPDDRDDRSVMLARDVLTPHHAEYYGKGGEANDYENPTPVPFLSVPPGTRFLMAVGGQRAWAEFAVDQLAEAISEWGLGAKTAAGYGRLEPIAPVRKPKSTVASAAARGLRAELDEWLATNRPADELVATWEKFVAAFCDRFQNQLRGVDDEQARKDLIQVVRSLIAGLKLSKKEKASLRARLDQI